MTDFLITDAAERQRLEEQLRAAGINAPGAQFYAVGETVIVPNPDGSPTSLALTGWPLIVTDVDRARGTITLTADDSMTDRIEPALTAEQWAQKETTGGKVCIEWDGFTRDDLRRNGRRVTPESRVVLSIGDETFRQDELPGLIALAIDALPDGDPRKITWATIRLLRQEFLYHLADALSSYLPPEGP